MSTNTAPRRDADSTTLTAAEWTPETLLEAYRKVRSASEWLAEPLTPEDMTVQSMPDTSPTKWHLAHTTWFFETLVLLEADPKASRYDETFAYLFNSYYNSLGAQYSRAHRGLISRPGAAAVMAYRRSVDTRMATLLGELDEDRFARLAPVIELGLHHEQQHQELILTDVKHMLAQNPLYPVYRDWHDAPDHDQPVPYTFHAFDGGTVWIGHSGDGFSYDNERPRHQALVHPFALGTRLVTCGEYLEFVADGGYRRPELWLSEGWAEIEAEGRQAPLYWHEREDGWQHFTLQGLRPVDPAEPVTHVSHFEADAYARWAGARLPTEFEWEVAAAATAELDGSFVDDRRLHPAPASGKAAAQPVQLLGDAWEWTASPYIGYPGYQPPEGAVGEYNGKFMSNQMVLRGGSCATPRSHIRFTYRNFFPSAARWQFTGIRLAQDV